MLYRIYSVNKPYYVHSLQKSKDKRSKNTRRVRHRLSRRLETVTEILISRRATRPGNIISQPYTPLGLDPRVSWNLLKLRFPLHFLPFHLPLIHPQSFLSKLL